MERNVAICIILYLAIQQLGIYPKESHMFKTKHYVHCYTVLTKNNQKCPIIEKWFK